MLWVWIIAAIVVLLVLASLSRNRKQRAAVARLRTHFSHIARLRLVAACPGLVDLLQEAELRMLFDWILIQLYGRTGASGFGELMQWSIERGQPETTQLTADVTREAVDRFSQPVLAVIDGCEGRAVTAVLIDQALTEAGERIGPKLNRKYV